MQYDVFISYSSKDSATAQAICHELEDNHIRCWMAPRDIPIGSKYATVITEAIISSKAVVLVFSERSAISPWVESEINIAFSNRKPIIPYKIDKAHLEDYSEFYLMLNNRHWIEAYPDFKTRFAELVGVVSKVVKPHVESFTTNRQTEEDCYNSPSVYGGSTVKPGGSSKRSAESTSLLKKLLFPVVAYLITALAINFWAEPKNDVGDTPVKTETVTQQSEILPPVIRQNDTNQQQTAQTKHLQQSLPAEPVKEEFVAPTTELYVTTTPSGAVVYVDETRVGTSSIEGKGIARGNHEVKLSKKGYEDRTFTRTFRDKPVVLNKTLVKTSQPVSTNAAELESGYEIDNAYYWEEDGKRVNYAEVADQGDVIAQFNLGDDYNNDEGVEQSYAKVMEWYRKAAEQGDANSQYLLGSCYEYGLGVTQDKSEAVKWYRKAAEQGYAVSQFNLDNYYNNGEGVEQSYAKVVEWYRKAAEQGDANSQYLLGSCYEYGLGVTQDKSEAVKWYRKAAEQGSVVAKGALKRLGY